MYAPYGSLAAAGHSVDRFPNWMDELGRGFSEDFFVYSVPSLPLPGAAISLAPAASTQRTLIIHDQACFEWMAISGSCWNGTTGAQITNPNIFVQITDQSSQRSMFASSSGSGGGNIGSPGIPWAAFVGSGQHPFILPIPKRMLAKGTFTITLTNYDTAATYSNIHLSFIGRQIFLRNGGDPLSVGDGMKRFRQWRGVDPVTGEDRLLSEDVFCFASQLNQFLIFPLTTRVFITPDADFEWIETTGCATNAPGNTPMTFNDWVASLAFIDGGTEKGLQNIDTGGSIGAGLALGVTVGTAAFPYVLPVPRLFLAKSYCDIIYANRDGGQNPTFIYLCQWGRKIFEATG